jgi:hypothetical protein
MKGKSNNWEHSDLQQTFWKGVVDYLNLSDALILQHVSSFFRLLIRTDTWTDILNKHGRMASKDQRMLILPYIWQESDSTYFLFRPATRYPRGVNKCFEIS